MNKRELINALEATNTPDDYEVNIYMPLMMINGELEISSNGKIDDVSDIGGEIAIETQQDPDDVEDDIEDIKDVVEND